jgi:hypothetical protein
VASFFAGAIVNDGRCGESGHFGWPATRPPTPSAAIYAGGGEPVRSRYSEPTKTRRLHVGRRIRDSAVHVTVVPALIAFVRGSPIRGEAATARLPESVGTNVADPFVPRKIAASATLAGASAIPRLSKASKKSGPVRFAGHRLGALLAVAAIGTFIPVVLRHETIG